jgi:hypothetical protein
MFNFKLRNIQFCYFFRRLHCVGKNEYVEAKCEVWYTIIRFKLLSSAYATDHSPACVNVQFPGRNAAKWLIIQLTLLKQCHLIFIENVLVSYVDWLLLL